MNELQTRFIDYVHSMYEHIRHAYGNPPVLVNLNVSLRDAVCEGVPPRDIGDEWFNIALYILIKCASWSDERIPQRLLPSPEMMEQYIIDNWES